MRLWQEIASQIADGKPPLGLYFSVWADSGVYLENVKKILSFSSEEVCVLSGKDTATVTGKDLFVKKYVEGDLLLGGKVCSVQVNRRGESS